MEKKLTVLSMILIVLCIVFGSSIYYLIYSHQDLKGIACEANAKFTYVNDLDNISVPMDIRLILKMHYVFFTSNKGIMTLNGVASSGDKRFFVSRNVNFTYVAQDDFYKFKYGNEQRSARDTLPSEVYSYFFNSESNFYHINYLDKDTLMFSNVYTPMFICNVKS